MSEAEPELGLGFITEVTPQQLTIRFPSSAQQRRYGRRSAPLKRVCWQAGDQVQTSEGLGFTVERVEVREDLFFYIGGGHCVAETDLSPKTRLLGPVDRILSGRWDAALAFELRRQTLGYWNRTLGSPVRGLLGPRVELIPHQVYVVSEVASRSLPRVLLADEVGLGKTIEAGWIVHHLLVTGRMSRILVLAPKSMVNQWFVELRRRFNLTFRVPESEEQAHGRLSEEFASHQQLILSLEALKDASTRGALEASSWDVIVVDEAHRVAWRADGASEEYTLLQKLGREARGLLLLTATPEQLGVEGHFGRLHLLDPQRFPSLEEYLAEHERYLEVARRAEGLVDKELRDLVDQYGTGRVYFRNTRRVVEAESYRFPRRIVRGYGLAQASDRVAWLKELLREQGADKVLLICGSREQAERVDAELKLLARVKTALFHEGQSLLVRDRSAAYFSEHDGARLLVSSEIGSEGRNFQFARHLVLWDLPEDPDLLEQRIGRLDRIGQRQEFLVHVPYVSGSREQALFRWYDEVFGIFERPAPGAAEVHGAFWPPDFDRLDEAIRAVRAEYEKKRQVLEQGRDRLIEINSFDARTALAEVATLQAAERAEELQEYLEGVFSWVGVNQEDLDDESQFVEPGDSMFIPVFPGLPEDGLRITFSRRKALEREDLTLLSWDHPLIRQTMEMIVAQEFGNASVSRWRDLSGTKPALVEAYFLLECATAPDWYAHEFFPPQPIRAVVNANGHLVTGEWPASRITKEASRARVVTVDWEKSGLRVRLRGLIERALEAATDSASAYRAEASSRLRARTQEEVERLGALARKNGLVSADEVRWWQDRQAQLEQAFGRADLRLDSIRIVF